MTQGKPMADFSKVSTAVINVGDGRGFVVEGRRGRLTLTAGHCFPKILPPHPLAYTEERTFARLLSALGEAERSIWAECLFVDPISDLAILGAPDGQALPVEWEAYEAFVDAHKTIEVGICQRTDRLWLLSLSGEWSPCDAQQRGLGIKFSGATAVFAVACQDLRPSTPSAERLRW